MKNWLSKFNEGLFTRTQFITGVAITVLATSTLAYAFQMLSLHTFTPGTPISSSKVNENFSMLNEALGKVPLGFAVGFQNTFGLDTMMSAPMPLDKVIYDFTEGKLAEGLVSDGILRINETGFYQILVYPKSYEGSGVVYLAGVGETSMISSMYLSASNTYMYSNNNNHIFLESGDDLEFQISNNGFESLIIDPEEFKIKLIKF